MDLHSIGEFYRDHSSWINPVGSALLPVLVWAVRASKRATGFLAWLFYLPIAAADWAFGLATFRSIRKGKLDLAVQGIIDKIGTARITPSDQNTLLHDNMRITANEVAVADSFGSWIPVQFSFLECWAVRNAYLARIAALKAEMRDNIRLAAAGAGGLSNSKA